MKRTMMGVISGLALWLGSALAAEAQQITPTGPMCVTPGTTTPTFTATVTIPTASYFYVRVQVLLNGVSVYYSQTFVPNPGTTTYSFSKNTLLSLVPQLGQTLTFSATLIYGGRSYAASDWTVVVAEPTGPTSKGKVFEPTSLFALQGIDRDRRHEA